MRASTLFVPIWGRGVRVHTHAARTVCAGTFRRERTVCAVSIAAATAQTRCAQTLDALSLPLSQSRVLMIPTLASDSLASLGGTGREALPATLRCFHASAAHAATHHATPPHVVRRPRSVAIIPLISQLFQLLLCRMVACVCGVCVSLSSREISCRC